MECPNCKHPLDLKSLEPEGECNCGTSDPSNHGELCNITIHSKKSECICPKEIVLVDCPEHGKSEAEKPKVFESTCHCGCSTAIYIDQLGEYHLETNRGIDCCESWEKPPELPEEFPEEMPHYTGGTVFEKKINKLIRYLDWMKKNG